jgi:hypothetical protein
MVRRFDYKTRFLSPLGDLPALRPFFRNDPVIPGSFYFELSLLIPSQRGETVHPPTVFPTALKKFLRGFLDRIQPQSHGFCRALLEQLFEDSE